MRDQLLPFDRIRAIQEELAGFILDEVVTPGGELFRYPKTLYMLERVCLVLDASTFTENTTQ